MTATTTFIGIFSLLFLWLLFYAIIVRRDKKKVKKLIKNYDEREDKSKQGEDYAKRLRAGDGEVESRDGGVESGQRKTSDGEPDSIYNDRPGTRQTLPIPSPSVVGKDSNIPRKNSSRKRKTSTSPRGIFRKLRRS